MKLFFIRFQGNFCVFDAEKILNFKTLIKDVKDNFNIRQKIQAFTYLFQDKTVRISNNSQLVIFLNCVKEKVLLITSEEIPILNVQITISKNGKKVPMSIQKMIDQDPFLSYNLDTQKVFCSSCDKELKNLNSWKLKRHLNCEHHRFKIPFYLKSQTKSKEWVFTNHEKNILRILDHLETFTTIDFYSRKDIPVFRTSLTKKRLFNQIQDKGNDLKYGTFCSLLQKYFSIHSATAFFFQCPKCSNPIMKKRQNHQRKVLEMRNLYKSEIQLLDQIILFLDFAVNFQEYRDNWETQEFYHKKSWVIFNITIQFEKQLFYFDYISEDQTKDSQFVLQSFQDFRYKFHEWQHKRNLLNISKLRIFSDNGGHIKNNFVLGMIFDAFSSQFLDIKVIFFLRNHAKHMSDRHFGNISRNKANFGDITTINLLFDYLSQLSNTTPIILNVNRALKFLYKNPIAKIQKSHIFIFLKGNLKTARMPNTNFRKRRIPIIEQIFQEKEFGIKQNSALIQENYSIPFFNTQMTNSKNEKVIPNETQKFHSQREKKMKEMNHMNGNLRSSSRKHQQIKRKIEFEEKEEIKNLRISKFQDNLPKQKNFTSSISICKTGNLRKIPNSHNSCYIASIIQVLLRTSVIELLGLGDISETLSDILQSSEESINITPLRKVIGEHVTQFSNTNEQDIHEFFVSLMDLISNENISDFNVPYDLLYQEFDIHNRAIINDFRIRIVQKVTCKKCKRFTYSFPQETSLVISFPILNGEISISSMLDNYFAEKDLDFSQHYHCENCDQKVESSIKLSLLTIPKYLVIFFKRTYYDSLTQSTTRIGTKIQCEEKINVKSFMFQSCPNQETEMKLLGSIHHIGNANEGHYWTEILETETSSNFFGISDAHIFPVNPFRTKDTFTMMIFTRED
ncbi:ubiquitin carboxyl-terminal hydrolase 22 [Anaeramoeba ignava]|uniref:Ubiquitin carboxyl-terminal hydrolase 22 n=1 Tax=Anaeramoeba ignava TaxID=1746090 RepID=A0A9Q0LSG6_ANAIG|nr:ubiquitin carboxyl-terminal hydrolase 22 [Anaeramoeba ignava]